jgi:hypothetical protein
MVKLLRRCLREALAKTSVLVDQGARLERDASTNVRAGRAGAPRGRRVRLRWPPSRGAQDAAGVRA